MKILAATKPEPEIRWKQLWSLAALYASVVVGWIAYKRYQPKLLVEFHFTQFSLLLVVAEAIIVTVTPPLAGLLGDRYRAEKGHRIPIISAGISFAAMIFMAVAFTLLAHPGETFKWILPVLIICWLIAMSIFTSPALSTLELFTPVEQLPRAMALLTIIGNLVYALEPVIVDIIDYAGAPATFMAGGAVVALSGLALKKNSLHLFKTQAGREEETEADADLGTARYGHILLLGIALGTATTVMFNLFPDVLQPRIGAWLHAANGKVLLVYILVLSAIVSWPASHMVTRLGLRKTFYGSLFLIVLVMTLLFVVQQPIVVLVLTLLFALLFSTLSVSSLPLAIRRAASDHKVFSVGIFFSGVALPDGIIEVLQALHLL
ncbi:MFS transporter [Fulvivirgaceae bacterium PWU5]|uniref:MFS transporter n=1 Tax=Dawidia cretensis TaxID=2782350 RepID=A0AAP2GUW8_9BACT|nr:MFS transporter [Dawidia cretensis]MBT1710083.1 MFS transporter [Dawidia cretensis]